MKKHRRISWQKSVLRQKVKVALVSVISFGIFFVCYQMLFVKQLSDVTLKDFTASAKRSPHNDTISLPTIRVTKQKLSIRNSEITPVKIRGIKLDDNDKYKPNSRGKFVCFDSKKEIDYDRINDDYCDCVSDGSDEPGTAACVNGKFFCETQVQSISVVPSSQVNDGICDCCDGSDEWSQIFLPFRLNEMMQKKLGRYHSPCPNLCPVDAK